MKEKNSEIKELINVEKFIDYNKTLKAESKTFEKLMFIYSLAIREIENKINILKDEFKIFYNYDLVEQINTRIKTPKSIINKMKDRKLELTYKEMIENINDIAGVRIIVPLKKDIFSIKNLIKKFPGMHVLKEKDYVTHPKESGYSSYHLIVEVPITLSQQVIYVKAEIQIRTIAMDLWAEYEHKMKYKSNKNINKKVSKEWINIAKTINKIDNKIMLLNN